MRKILLLILTIFIFLNPSAATLNCIIITDPSGTNPNGVAAGSMSFAQNMFQSTFILSKDDRFSVLSGGEGETIPRLGAIVETINRLEGGSTAAEAAASASSFPGIRVMAGGPRIGAAVGGSFDAYVVIVSGDKITVTPYSGGLAVLPPGEKGAIIHLRNTHGNPMYGTAASVRQSTAILIGRMIYQGYNATDIMGKVFENVAKKAGEKYGGGAVNIDSGISTGDMFTPQKLNETGYPMDEVYSKVCPLDGWSVGYPTSNMYTTCPNDGTPLKTVYAYDALKNAITVITNSVQVTVYGSDADGVIQTATEIVKYSVKKHGYSAIEISNDINKGISDGILVGVNYVEPKDINVKPNSRAVGVYFKPLVDHRSAPPWNLPISSSTLNILGNMQTAIGFVLVLLVLFRSRLFT
jgi:hypothetical protein